MGYDTQDRYLNLVGRSVSAYNSRGIPDLRALTLSHMISRRFEDLSESNKHRLLSPHLLGVAVIPNSNKLRDGSAVESFYKSQPKYLYIMRYRGYPAVLGLEYVDPKHWFAHMWFNTRPLNEEALFILGTSKLYKVDHHKVSSLSLYKPLRYVFDTGHGSSHLGGGETVNGMWRTVKMGLYSTTRARAENLYLGFLVRLAQANKAFRTKAFIDHMNEKMPKSFGFKLNTGEHVLHLWEQISGETYLKAIEYWHGASDAGDPYDYIRTSIYEELLSNGIERVGDKPGSYIWYNPKNNGYFPENLDFVSDYFTEKDMSKCIEEVAPGSSHVLSMSNKGPMSDYKMRKVVEELIIKNLHKSCVRQFKRLKKEEG
ncbi:hypothetical protein [Methylophaga sp.]|uniref:hypothetical protein n=1 Tax=Methylophaga sp. TaxID=2024840 RepID=UPI000C433C09|nr:hypothetical protein [Methylophaga sp.]MBP23869.1 hypothetical protein [Methylophaga sp.]|tara:strand:+ start:5911 stop:7023 length:1113 start_codon:yes stop_codon:yes gene_type:complete